METTQALEPDCPGLCPIDLGIKVSLGKLLILPKPQG